MVGSYPAPQRRSPSAIVLVIVQRISTVTVKPIPLPPGNQFMRLIANHFQ